MKLTLAKNSSLASAFKTRDLLVLHPAGATLCIDEPAPEETEGASIVRQIGGEVTAPQVIKRVEPQFPTMVGRAMGSGANVVVVIEAVITKEGCVRTVRILSQSPYGELNAAALLALSKWKFSPGRLDGKPVDVIFNLTVNFRVGH